MSGKQDKLNLLMQSQGDESSSEEDNKMVDEDEEMEGEGDDDDDYHQVKKPNIPLVKNLFDFVSDKRKEMKENNKELEGINDDSIEDEVVDGEDEKTKKKRIMMNEKDAEDYKNNGTGDYEKIGIDDSEAKDKNNEGSYVPSPQKMEDEGDEEDEEDEDDEKKKSKNVEKMTDENSDDSDDDSDDDDFKEKMKELKRLKKEKKLKKLRKKEKKEKKKKIGPLRIERVDEDGDKQVCRFIPAQPKDRKRYIKLKKIKNSIVFEPKKPSAKRQMEYPSLINCDQLGLIWVEDEDGNGQAIPFSRRGAEKVMFQPSTLYYQRQFCYELSTKPLKKQVGENFIIDSDQSDESNKVSNQEILQNKKYFQSYYHQDGSKNRIKKKEIKLSNGITITIPFGIAEQAKQLKWWNNVRKDPNYQIDIDIKRNEKMKKMKKMKKITKKKKKEPKQNRKKVDDDDNESNDINDEKERRKRKKEHKKAKIRDQKKKEEKKNKKKKKKKKNKPIMSSSDNEEEEEEKKITKKRKRKREQMSDEEKEEEEKKEVKTKSHKSKHKILDNYFLEKLGDLFIDFGENIKKNIKNL